MLICMLYDAVTDMQAMGNTALHAVCGKSDDWGSEVIAALIAAEVDINAKNVRYQIALRLPRQCMQSVQIRHRRLSLC